MLEQLFVPHYPIQQDFSGIMWYKLFLIKQLFSFSLRVTLATFIISHQPVVEIMDIDAGDDYSFV